MTQARENRVRKIKIEAPRGDIVDRDGNRLVRTRVAPVVQIVPSGLPEAELKVADSYRAARSSAERTRLAAADQLRSLERTRREEERRYTRAERRERRVLVARVAPRAARSRCRRCPPTEPQLRRSFRRLGRVLGMSPRTIHRRVIEGVAEAPYSNVTIKTDVPRAAFNYLKERKDEFPGVDVEKLFLRDYPHKDLAAQLFGTLREISPAGAQEEEVPRRRGGHAHRQGRHRGDLRPLPARPGRLHAGGRQRARQPRRPPRGHAPRAPAGPAAAPDARPRPPAGRQQRAQARDRGRQRQRQPGPGGRLRGDGPDQRRGARARLLPELRRQRLRQAALAGDLRQAQLRGERRAAVQPRDRRRLSDRLDVQADHRDGLAARRASSHRRRRSSTTASSSSARRSSRTPRTPRYGLLVAAARAPGLLRRLLLHARRARELARRRSSRGGPAGSASGTGPGSTSPASSTGSCPTARGATRASRSTRAASSASKRDGADAGGAEGLRRHRAAVVHGRQRQPRGRPGRPPGHAAADGDGLLGDRQRRQGRAPAPGDERRGRPRARRRAVPHHRQAAREVLRHQPGDDHGRPAPRDLGGGRHLRGCLRGLCGRQASGLRQDRYRGAAGAARPVLVRLPTCPIPAAPSSSSSPSRRAASAPRRRLRRRG